MGSRSASYLLFRQPGGGLVAALQGLPTLYGGVALTFWVTASGGQGVRVTDAVGVDTFYNGSTLALQATGPPMYISDLSEISLASVEPLPGYYRPFEAEAGPRSAGWVLGTGAGWSNGTYLDLWQAAEPTDPDGYWAEVPFLLGSAGAYDLVLSGTALTLLGPPAGTSPFRWCVDGGPWNYVASAAQVEDLSAAIPGMPAGPSRLASSLRLAAGNHTFRLALTGRRVRFDNRYAMWFDAVVLIPTQS